MELITEETRLLKYLQRTDESVHSAISIVNKNVVYIFGGDM